MRDVAADDHDQVRAARLGHGDGLKVVWLSVRANTAITHDCALIQSAGTACRATKLGIDLEENIRSILTVLSILMLELLALNNLAVDRILVVM